MQKLEPTYQGALKLLRHRRRQGRPPSSASNSSNQPLRGRPACDGMRSWLNQIGHSDAVIDQLRVIHIAGTKGKGSTCAFAEAFLNAYCYNTGFPDKYGLYTSPALQEETERIRINSKQISKEDFTKNVFEVWDSLQGSGSLNASLPRFLQLVLLVGIHTFIKEGVKVAILETHHGGQYDSTNIFREPAATGVTSLGFDHVAQLGPTIADIAWHKAGIFKAGSPAFTVTDQPEAARTVLIDRAQTASTELQIVGIDATLPSDQITIRPEVQRLNCSLAKAVVNAYLEQYAPKGRRHLNDLDVKHALKNLHLPGRFQSLSSGCVAWYLDGAHNAMSIDNPVHWFSKETADSLQTNSEALETSGCDRKSARVLVFSHISEERDGEEVLGALIDSVRKNKVLFDHVIFCYDGVRRDGSMKEDLNFGIEADQSHYALIWERAGLPGKVANMSTLDGTIHLVEAIGLGYSHMDVLITGSFHLVGGMLTRIRSASYSSSAAAS